MTPVPTTEWRSGTRAPWPRNSSPEHPASFELTDNEFNFHFSNICCLLAVLYTYQATYSVCFACSWKNVKQLYAEVKYTFPIFSGFLAAYNIILYIIKNCVKLVFQVILIVPMLSKANLISPKFI